MDAYDQHQKELEEKLDEKTALLIKYQRIYMETRVDSPGKVREVEWSLPMTNGKPSELNAPLEVSEAVEGEEAIIPQPSPMQEEPSREYDSDVIRQLNIQSFLENELKSAYSAKANRVYDGPGADIMEGQRLATISVLKKLLQSAKNGVVSDRVVSDRVVSNGDTVPPGSAYNSEVVDELRQEKGNLEKSLHAWQAHCEALTKERNAMQSIMESKVAMLVDKVSSSIGDVLRSIPNKDPRATQLVQKVSFKVPLEYFNVPF